MSEDNPSRQKFKWTKELVNIALNDGMTQEEIARVCRTQQSVVSSWKNGKNKATEQQLAELLRRYGARLNRTTARVYLSYEKPIGTWQETATGVQLLELQKRSAALNAQVAEHRKAAAEQRNAEIKAENERRRALASDDSFLHMPMGYSAQYQPTAAETDAYQQIQAAIKELQREIAPHAQHDMHLDMLIQLYREDFAARGRRRLVQVEGPILFRYTFFRLVGRAFRRGIDIIKEPIGRWIVHDLHRGKLLLISQGRRELVGTAKQRWEAEFDEAKKTVSELAKHSSRMSIPPLIVSEAVECADDAGRWFSFVKGPLTVEQLLDTVDKYLSNHKTMHNPHDEQVLPYLIRKALLEHGHPVPDIDRITGLE